MKSFVASQLQQATATELSFLKFSQEKTMRRLTLCLQKGKRHSMLNLKISGLSIWRGMGLGMLPYSQHSKQSQPTVNGSPHQTPSYFYLLP